MNTRLGSSKQMAKQLAFSGLLGNKAQFNPGKFSFPSTLLYMFFSFFLVIAYDRMYLKSQTLVIFKPPDFYNWNRVKVRYCDGSSFTGDVAAVNPVCMLY